MSQITTLTFFQYKGLKPKLWAFGMMQFAHAPLAKTDGLQFYKLLGTGKELGKPTPDWGTYGLLQVWDSEEKATNFFESSSLYQRYKKQCAESLTIYLRSIIARGYWSGLQPFETSKDLRPENQLLAIITRATIKASKMRQFWRYAPVSEQPLHGSDGLILTKGIGETPFFQMATFSIWRDKESLKGFAYQSAQHKEAIDKTKTIGWYSEELFSRFQPYRSVGTWQGKNPLPELEF